MVGGDFEIGRQRQAEADQQRAERDQRPIGQHPLAPRPRRRHPPDHVELVFDRDQQQNPGRGDADDADRRGLRRGIGEGAKPPRRLVADRGHEILEHQRQDLVVHLPEDREHRQRAERNRGERDQRNEGGVAERARGGKAAVGVEAAQRIGDKGGQGRHHPPQIAASSARSALLRLAFHPENLIASHLANTTAAGDYPPPAGAAPAPRPAGSPIGPSRRVRVGWPCLR